ncbi:hypothetical protein nbrc107696_18160 [Gordonia spumicola]|uniref:LytR/CpsA/Psr regulator C-terminal domain-containing protein n=2 Tax=Gordonia spumicola TaxID=589161 RepID=A0A7I9V8E5_9ACTN|nr:hypothetical protein nbrc107696_18160 [Gordonia spumicola]
MLLLAIAVVFIGLGLKSVMDSGDDPAADLANAESSAPASPTPSAPATKTPTKQAPSTVADAADVGGICVYNVGTIAGLAAKTSTALTNAGFTVEATENYQTRSISENTIFYGAGQEAAARKVAESVPGGAAPSERPAAFTKCPDKLVVLVTSE